MQNQRCKRQFCYWIIVFAISFVLFILLQADGCNSALSLCQTFDAQYSGIVISQSMYIEQCKNNTCYNPTITIEYSTNRTCVYNTFITTNFDDAMNILEEYQNNTQVEVFIYKNTNGNICAVNAVSRSATLSAAIGLAFGMLAIIAILAILWLIAEWCCLYSIETHMSNHPESVSIDIEGREGHEEVRRN